MSTNPNKTDNSFFMKLALLQANMVLGNTQANPAVGCVIVKDNSIVSAGSTGINGTPHAENVAINLYKKKVKDEKLFTTLEPCSHYGKTPPCVNLIVKKKFKKVFFSIKDPDFRSFNKSSLKFLKNKIAVQNGLLNTEVQDFYRSYIKFKKRNIPFVTAKIAVSKDLYSKNLKKKWITNIYSRGRVHMLRSEHDVILTSVKTIIDDNPLLTCRIPGLEQRSPTRIILDKNLKIPKGSKIVRSAKKFNTIIFFNKYNKKKINFLKKNKIKLIKANIYNQNLDLKKILTKIKNLGFSRVFLESGIKLTSVFMSNKLVDDFYMFISDNKIKKNGNLSFKKFMRLYLINKKIIEPKVNLFGDKLILYKLK